MALASEAAPIHFEPFDPDSRARRFELYEQLREHAPVYQAASGFWVLSRFEHVRDVLKNPAGFSSRPAQDEGQGVSDLDLGTMEPELLERLMTAVAEMPVDMAELMGTRSIIGADPPEHTRLRRLVTKAFSHKRVSAMTDHVHELAAGYADGLDRDETFEIVERIAGPLPVRVISDLLSVEPEHRADVRRWSDLMIESAHTAVRGTAEAQLMMVELLNEFSNYFVPRLDDRRANSTGDLLSDLVAAEGSEQLTTTEALLQLFTIMAAGNESTTNLIGNTVVDLLRNPDQLEILVSEPDLIPNAVEESARLYSPFQFTLREAVADAVIDGVKIPAGSVIVTLIGSANRDPRHFGEPERFDVRRDVSQHLGWGQSVHFCLGTHLGRLEAAAALRAIVPHLDRYDLASEPNLLGSPLLFGYERVELRAKR